MFNATGQDMKSLSLIQDEGPAAQFSPTADGQAWLKPFRANRSIGFRWITADGEEFGASEPLESHVSSRFHGDLLIRILGPGSMKISRVKLPDDF